MGNSNLTAARKAKNDEFYTAWRDIENEMNAYLAHNPDVFRGKTVLLPCDDPESSNFTRFFALNFEALGIKRLISTSYTPEPGGKGRVFVLEQGGEYDADRLVWDYLEGDGDFRSAEVTALRDEADMVITNPPFSLYREFVAWLVEGGVQFSVIGSKNSVAYKEVFPLIKGNEMWVGSRSMSVDMLFDLPESRKAELLATEKPGSKYRIVDGDVRGRAASLWFTNIEHGRRHEFLELMTMEDNRLYSRRKKIREEGYPKYDNYDAIEVAFTEAIPSNYAGVMGVPISFLDKYDPTQFEIVDYPDGKVSPSQWAAIVGGAQKYSRILIRHKRP